jgi:hypothetical protein
MFLHRPARAPQSFVFFGNEWVLSTITRLNHHSQTDPPGLSDRVTKGLIRYWGTRPRY